MSSRQQNAIRQIREIVLMNLQSIPQRLGASLVFVVGISGVLALLVAMLSMSAGLTRTLGTTGRMDRAVVLRGGSTAELSSFLDRALVTLIKQDPAIARGRDGLPLASVLPLVFQVDGFCSTPYPPVLGLSLAQWALVAFVLTAVLVPLGIVRNRRGR